MSYIIRLLSATDRVRAFSSGSAENQPLKSFLQKDALPLQSAGIAKTFVAVSPEETEPMVLGFITLVCSEIKLSDGVQLVDCANADRYDSLPAIKIARLATDSRHRGKGIGKALLDLALAITQDEVSQLVGCRFLITDAKAGAVGFYERHGFTMLDTPENRALPTPVMFIDLAKFERTEDAQESLPLQMAAQSFSNENGGPVQTT